MVGALSFSDKQVEQIVSPKIVVYGLKDDVATDSELLPELKEKDLPVFPLLEKTQMMWLG
jgi:hypothetical protein